MWREPGVIIRRVLFAAGGVSLASSAMIYNIVKVKVTRWPVDPFDSWLVEPSTCWPFRKRTPQGQLRGPPTYTVEMWAVDPFDPLTRWPVDSLTRRPFRKRTPQDPPIYTVEMQCNSRRAKGAELDSAAASKRSRCSVWHEAGAYII